MEQPPLPSSWSDQEVTSYLNQPLILGNKPLPGTEGMTIQQIEDDVLRGGRFRIFLWNFSLIVLSFQRNTSVRYFRSSESPGAQALLWSMLSFLIGWWGIPWGIFFTIHTLWTNSLGGKDVTKEILTSVTGPDRANSVCDKAAKPNAGVLLWVLRILLLALLTTILLFIAQLVTGASAD